MQNELLLALGITLLLILLVRSSCSRQTHIRSLLDERTRELASSESAYRLLFEKNPGAVLVYSLQTRRVLTINPAFTRLLGYSEEEAVGQPIDLLTPKDQQVALQATVSQIVQRTDPAPLRQVRLRQRHKDGRELELEIHSQTINYLGQRARIVIAQDITEREQFRYELEHYHEQLERLVEQRTAALSAANQEAEAANHAKTAFLANMSHELRTPLNAVIGFSGLLERDPSISPENRKSIATIKQAGQKLLGLINDVLEISGLDIQRGMEHAETIRLDDTIREITAPLQERAIRHGLAFVIELDVHNSPWVRIDARRLRHILANLLGNAIKYTQQGHVSLRVFTSDDRLKFEVSDTGPGISVGEREHIFEAFYQTSIGADSGEGTGIGLYLSRQYARFMGGELNLCEQTGGGSLFVLDLPLQAVDAPTAPDPDAATTVTTGNHKDIRLLVVDDQADNRWLVTQIMESAGFHVRCAENGQESIDIFLDWHPHLICMDMRMPVLDGYEASRRIRALPKGAEVKIIAMTGNTLNEEIQDILAAGCDAVITKPLDEQEVFTTLGMLLGSKYLDRSGASAEATEPRVKLDLSTLSPARRSALASAAVRLDGDICRQITAEIQKDDPELGQQIGTLIDNFRFDYILDLCTAIPRETSEPPVHQGIACRG